MFLSHIVGQSYKPNDRLTLPQVDFQKYCFYKKKEHKKVSRDMKGFASMVFPTSTSISSTWLQTGL